MSTDNPVSPPTGDYQFSSAEYFRNVAVLSPHEVERMHLNAAADEIERLRAVLQRLADCDWVITPGDRMDAVRKIARDALGGYLP